MLESSIHETGNPFLSKVSSRLLRQFLLRRAPPKTEDFLVRSSIEKGKHIVEIWFRTRGCHHFLRGGCTMCNYGLGDTVQPEQMVNFVDRAFNSVQLNENTNLIISPSGSMLDDWEVPESAREGIFKLANKKTWTSLSFETRAQFVTDRSIQQIRHLLGQRLIKADVAVECADKWILKYAINKNLSLTDFVQAIDVLKNNNFKATTNVLLGAPFVTEREMIQKAEDSINWVFQNGVDECCLFPVHVKHGTLVHWLWEREYYTPPSLWSLVEVLKNIDPSNYSRLSIAWHKPYYMESESVEVVYTLAPSTCPNCYTQVIKLLDEYLNGRKVATIQRLNDIECDCKKVWIEELNKKTEFSLLDRVATIYELMGKEILGEDWWIENGKEILNDLRNSYKG